MDFNLSDKHGVLLQSSARCGRLRVRRLPDRNEDGPLGGAHNLMETSGMQMDLQRTINYFL